MASTATLTLDTTAPSVSLQIDGGASTTTDLDVDLTITSAAVDKYQMKIYGDVSDTFATAEYRALEANAPWIAFAGTKTGVKITSGDGSKTIRIKVVDDVGNVSSEATATITLNTAIPTITISTPLSASETDASSNPKISKISGKDTATLGFTSNVALDQWQVRRVPNATDTVAAGTVIPQTAGSTTQGTTLAASTEQTVTIKGTDFESAGASGTGTPEGNSYIVKVFGRNASNGLWSVGS
jgi:hypothetical protein